MDTMPCYLCSRLATAEVCPTIGAHQWAVPLCLEHLGDGVALLHRMFPDNVEMESRCEVLRVGDWELLPQEGEDRG